jgi:hypothetical protein
VRVRVRGTRQGWGWGTHQGWGTVKVRGAGTDLEMGVVMVRVKVKAWVMERASLLQVLLYCCTAAA